MNIRHMFDELLPVKTLKFCQHWTYCNCIMRGCVGVGVVEEELESDNAGSSSTGINNSISSCNDCLSGSCGSNFSVGSIDSSN